jgi:hypothetical protein
MNENKKKKLFKNQINPVLAGLVGDQKDNALPIEKTGVLRSHKNLSRRGSEGYGGKNAKLNSNDAFVGRSVET